MKSLDDLKKIRDAAQSKVTMRGKNDGIRLSWYGYLRN